MFASGTRGEVTGRSTAPSWRPHNLRRFVVVQAGRPDRPAGGGEGARGGLAGLRVRDGTGGVRGGTLMTSNIQTKVSV